MALKPTPRIVTAARWPLGIALTSFAYLWRTTPIHRREVDGSWPEDAPPGVGEGVDRSGIQRVEDGSGPYLRRRYRAVVAGARTGAPEVMAEIRDDPNIVVPNGLAHFTKVSGAERGMEVGDEFTVRMPGPWDGPVRVAEVTPTSFRFMTCDGHIEAGQIEWRARDDGDRLVFEIESWSRPGDRVSHVMHHRLHMAKEVQLHMWTSVLERVIRRYGTGRAGPLDIDTRRVDLPT